MYSKTAAVALLPRQRNQNDLQRHDDRCAKHGLAALSVALQILEHHQLVEREGAKPTSILAAQAGLAEITRVVSKHLRPMHILVRWQIEVGEIDGKQSRHVRAQDGIQKGLLVRIGDDKGRAWVLAIDFHRNEDQWGCALVVLAVITPVNQTKGQVSDLQAALYHLLACFSAPEPVRRPARVAIMLALAHKIQHAIDRGVVSDRAEVARRLGLTRARITQLLDLTLLPPQAQERILFIQSVDGLEPLSEAQLRSMNIRFDGRSAF